VEEGGNDIALIKIELMKRRGMRANLGGTIRKASRLKEMR